MQKQSKLECKSLPLPAASGLLGKFRGMLDDADKDDEPPQRARSLAGNRTLSRNLSVSQKSPASQAVSPDLCDGSIG